ncbi:MAG: tRNA (adenosine(37)-N6)-threonylcarbamoyltransferase complex dimerization subunit type 1 TsaB [Proteobacteria bacterium]|nr:tRNA (adenosine(37)-N6)-threonylcarbamoyltransferase complex dimerization subunit type 1 TsaB [Pseudomonadota bacterium]
MVILAYSTISDMLSIALFNQREKKPFVVFQESVFREHATVLIPRIQDFLRKENLTFEDIGAIAVCSGPGSFTGARIGCAAALGFSAFKEIPLLGINTFQMYAKYLFEKDGVQHRPCLILLKSGHDELCVASLDVNLLPVPGLFEKPQCLEKESFLNLIKKDKTPYIIAGDAFFTQEEIKGIPLKYNCILDQDIILAEWVGKAAITLMDQNIYPPMTPLYVKPAYVKIPQ